MKNLKSNGLLITIIIYLLLTVNMIIFNPVFYTNVINPLFWLCILVSLLFNINKNYIRCRNKNYYMYMFVISCIYTIIYFYIGFIFGFSKSPYKHKLISVLKNIIIQVLPIVSIEFVRTIIIYRNKRKRLLFLFTTILLILLEIKYNILIDLIVDKENLFKYICGTIFPLISNSILFTYLNFKEAYLSPVIFILFREGIRLFLPILPNTDWFINGSFNILSSVLIYVLFKYKLIKENKQTLKKQNNSYSKISYSIAIIFSISLVCFMLGIFKYKPIVILTNSMLPTFCRGDIVIFEKINSVNIKEISKDKIIVYSIGNQNIVHRVSSIVGEGNKILYKTKGDNNNIADIKLVENSQIQGIYVFHIKYIGFPSVWLYEFFNNQT